jgi:hypothetical protein
MRLRIQLVPELNVLTVDFENRNFRSDQILSSPSDTGRYLKLKREGSLPHLIISDLNTCNERVYEWVHTWAGLFLEVNKPGRGL